MTRIKLIARGMTTAVLAMATQVVSAQTMYRVVEFPAEAIGPTAITSDGKLLVYGPAGRQYLCRPEHCRRLPDVAYGGWLDINDKGMLAGFGAKPNGSSPWVVRKDPQEGGGVKFLTRGQGLAIAPDGTVVGNTGAKRAFMYTDHRIELDGLTGLYPVPEAINSHHVVVGRSNASDEQAHATMWVDGGPPQDLGLAPGHIASGAKAINDAGIVVGFSYHPTLQHQPARFADGSVQVFQLPNLNDWGWAMGINASGTIVGYFATADGSRAGIVEGDRMVDLNTRLRPHDARRYKLWEASAINDAGEIAATSVDPQNENARAVRLEPIVEP